MKRKRRKANADELISVEEARRLIDERRNLIVAPLHDEVRLKEIAEIIAAINASDDSPARKHERRLRALEEFVAPAIKNCDLAEQMPWPWDAKQ